MLDKIDGSMLKEMFIAGAGLLETNKEGVDVLNVFPVPDGDTGTNMSMTLAMAVSEVQELPADSVEKISSVFARGALRGARGNSGVILSQLFRGFAKGMEGHKAVDTVLFAQALQSGVEMAYKAVMKPREGTILTVARAAADAAVKAARRQKDFEKLIVTIIDAAEDMLQKTPEMLPVLKEAGVVDSGGRGLIIIYAGFKMAIDGEEMRFEFEKPIKPETSVLEGYGIASQSTEDIHFTYCTEFFITHLRDDCDEKMQESFREKLQKVGDSIVFVPDDDLIKVHVHSNCPGKILQLALRMGELSHIKIDNMKEQHRSLLEEAPAPQKPAVPPKEYGMVAVAAGAGLEAIFKDLNVDCVVRGGQTMNPSIEDIARAVDSINAEKVFVFPNNSNIILAAQQASQLTEKQMCIIPTKSVPQGIAAVLNFDPDISMQENEQHMVSAIATVQTGQVTYAVRDTHFEENEIHEGDIIGLANNKLTCVGNDVPDVSMELMEQLMDEEKEVISVFYGEDITKDAAQALCDALAEKYPDCDIEMHEGGQPLYYYIFSVE
nr:DAK2 domain-containing protein [Maliibacterium massiliense]